MAASCRPSAAVAAWIKDRGVTVNAFLWNRRRKFLRGNLGLNLRTGFLSASLILIALPAFAGLGEDFSSVQADQAHMQGALRSTQTAAYTVHEITAPSGVIV